jgi:serine/threonine protein kinase
MERHPNSKTTDGFVARNTIHVVHKSISSFDGKNSSLHPATRSTFHPVADPPELTKNIRAENLTIARIVECITIALTDVRNESLGRPCLFPNPTDGTQTKKDNDHVYKVQNITFNPMGCKWFATVTYSCASVSTIAAGEEPIKHNICEGKIPICVECTTVFLPSSSTKDDRDSRMHYSIDVTMLLKKDLNIIEKPVRNALLEVIMRLTNDISKQITKESLPLFPEGNQGIAFRKIYQLNKKLKSGSFATVCAGTHRKTGKRCAVKCVYRKKLTPNDDSTILSEVQIMSSIRHPSICPIWDFFMEDECYFIVMPLMEGGDVFDKIANMKKYDENIARNLVSDMIKAIAHLHENNIAHCDLKSRNLLLSSNNDDSSVILADFGFAARVYSPKSLTKQCGTPYFVAPEILLQNGYDTQSDMWSVGIIIYSLLSGGLPFTGKTHLELFKAIIKGGFDFNATQWDEVSASAKDLISKLLVKDPSSRLSAHDALCHSWIRADEHLLQRNSLLNTSFRLKTFNARLTLKSAILATHSMIIWRNLTRDGKSKAAGISDINRESHNNPHNVEVDEDKLLGIEESAKESLKES